MSWLRKWWRSWRLRVWERRLEYRRFKLEAFQWDAHSQLRALGLIWEASPEAEDELACDLAAAAFKVGLLRRLVAPLPLMRSVDRDKEEAR